MTVSLPGPGAAPRHRAGGRRRDQPEQRARRRPPPASGARAEAVRLLVERARRPAPPRGGRLARRRARAQLVHALARRRHDPRRAPERAGDEAVARARASPCGPSSTRRCGGSALIDTPAGRTRVVARIGALAARYRLAGVTLDMEEMLPRQRASYSTLVAQLAAALHAKHRKLAIYAVRRTATDVDDGAAAYDWAALARAADLVLASGYNEHSATTAPGPVTTAGRLRGPRLVRRRDVARPGRADDGRVRLPVDRRRRADDLERRRRAPLAGGGRGRQRRRPFARSRARRRRGSRRPRTCGRRSRRRAARARSGSGCSRSAASPSASGSARSCGSRAPPRSVARDDSAGQPSTQASADSSWRSGVRAALSARPLRVRRRTTIS